MHVIQRKKGFFRFQTWSYNKKFLDKTIQKGPYEDLNPDLINTTLRYLLKMYFIFSKNVPLPRKLHFLERLLVSKYSSKF